ncbi:MAG: carbohydrate kinase family protein [Candidatus Bathyarchaeota archaeon]|nr:carbohydrate kinase family protein [Candidatus Bathyarchaeota archaeon]
MFVGHISVDKIENINGSRLQPGGAALYAAMAARTLSNCVTLISATGNDNKFLDVLRGFPYKDVKIYDEPSTKFHIKYDRHWEAHYLKTVHGAGSKITSRRISDRWLKHTSIFHISPMQPSKVARILEKIKKKSPETKVSVNTWIGYIKEGQRNRKILRDIAAKADFFIVSDTEIKALAQTDSISIAVRLLKAKRLIVTLGNLGAIISEDGDLQMVPALNLAPDKIVDTTGAGDVWCGAFIATYNLTENFGKAVSAASTISRIKCTDWGFTSLVDLRFKEPNDVIEFVMGLKDGGIQKRMLDYMKD